MNILKALKKYRYDIMIGLAVVALALLFFFLRDEFGFLSNRESFEEFIRSFGPLAPLAIVLVIVLEVVFAPIPGSIPPITAGFIFGPVEGALYAFIGNVLGTTIAFFIARRLGKKFVLKFVKEDKLDKYEAAIERRENILLLLYFVPVFPTDVISFAFGLSRIGYRKFITFMAIGYFFYVSILTYFGDYLAELYF